MNILLLHVTYWTKSDPAGVYMYFSIYIHKNNDSEM